MNKEKFFGSIQGNIFSVAHLQQGRLKTDFLVSIEGDDSIFVLVGIEHIFTLWEFHNISFGYWFPIVVRKLKLHALLGLSEDLNFC